MPATINKEIKSAGGDYASASLWEATEGGSNLTTADEIHQGECFGFQDTTACVIDGATTDATRYLRLYAASGAEAQMPYNTDGTAYRLEVGSGTGVTASDDYTRVERIQVRSSGSGGAAIAIHISSGAEVRLVGCIGRGPGGTGGSNATGITVNNPGSASNTFIINCVSYDWNASAACFEFSASAAKIFMYNCTAIGNGSNGTGFDLTSATTGSKLTNCLAADFNAGSCYGTIDADITESFNAADDTTASGTGSRDSQTFTFVDAASDDFHLASGDGGAKDFGTDLSGDGDFPFSDDFDAVTRSGSWDIGADEFVGAGGFTPRGYPRGVNRGLMRGVA